MKKIILILLLSPLALYAQEEPQKIIDQFFSLYRTKGANESVDYIFSTNKWMDESKDQIENVKFRLNGTIKLLGKYEGYNLITKKTVGEYLMLYTFMVRYDRQPLRFSLLFYKPSSEWKLYNFSYDDNFDEELKEAAKTYRLKENLPD
jgi:hypothetical protein